MAEQSTLLIVKPDAVRRGLIGEVLSRVEANGLRVEALRMMEIDRELAERHYVLRRARGVHHVGAGGRGQGAG